MMDLDESMLCFYYYYGVIFVKIEVCCDFINGMNGELNYCEIKNCILDQIMMMFGMCVKQFELEIIGKLLFNLV